MDARPEDRNARQQFADFPEGAPLAGLEAFFAFIRGQGAPDDAHPVVKVNERGEIVGIVCVTKRAVQA